MAWDDHMQRLGAQLESEYVRWSAENRDPELEPSYHKGTKQGYIRWIDRAYGTDPHRFRHLRDAYDHQYPFGEYVADHSWRPGPVGRAKKNTPPQTLWLYAEEELPPTMTIPDAKVLGGFKTIPITETTGTVGDFDDMVTAEEAELSVWEEKLAGKRALANAMLREARGDRAVLISRLAQRVEPATEPEPEPEPA